MYPPELVQPMKDDLTSAGYEELLTADAVAEAVNRKGTVLVMLNSVCGCSAGNARPAAKYVAQQTDYKKPDFFVTSFAGVDKEAVNKVREFTLPYPPSSPSMALFKDGELVHFIERLSIEGNTAQGVAENLIGAFNKHC